jgi:hypothetical protein
MSTATATLPSMGKRKQQPDKSPQKPRKLVGIPPRIAAAMEEVAESRETTLTEMVKVACIDFLVKHDRWPPRS